jgi:hypothetical protein
MSLFRRTGRDDHNRDHDEDLDRIRAEITRLHNALRLDQQERAAATSSGDGELTARLDALADQLAALDQRITAVATELANQLGELGHEIDALAGPAAPVPDEALDALRDSQTRLANEQARYQIAFRADLARLAEDLRRPR